MSCQGGGKHEAEALKITYKRFLVAMRFGDTPVPIPNTKVKTKAADGTAQETVWESRWLPGYKKE